MKIQLFLSSALCISNLNAMETPPRAESPHERVITTLNFDSDLANNRGIGNLQLMLTNQSEDTLETRYLSPEDYQSVRIITGCSAIDENPEKTNCIPVFFWKNSRKLPLNYSNGKNLARQTHQHFLCCQL